MQSSSKNPGDQKKRELKYIRKGVLLDAMNKVFRQSIKSSKDGDVARVCLNVAEKITHSQFGFICEINENGRFDTIAISDTGWDSCRISESDALLMLNDLEVRGIRGLVIDQNKSMLFNDPSSDSAFISPPKGHPKLTSFMGVPLKRLGKNIGMIGLANKQSGYTQEDINDIEELSHSFIIAINRIRVHVALEEKNREYLTLYEEYESQNEELRSLNEELRAKNDELLEKNHEYHALNEEYESQNEEIKSINEELQVKNKELETSYQKIRDSEKKYKNLFTTMLNGFALHEIITDKKGKPVDYRFLELNPAFEKLTGIKAKDIVGKTVLKALPGIEKFWIERYGKVALTGKPAHFENYAMALDKYYHVLAYSPEKGKFAVIFEDITQQKKLEQERERILTTTTDLICIAGEDGYFKYVNPAWEKTLGYKHNEFLKRPFLDFIHPDDHEMNDEEVDKLMDGKLTMNFTNRYICKDKSVRHISWRATPIPEEKLIYCIGRDITEQLEAEEELKRKNEEYFSLNEEYEAQNEELISINEELQEKNKKFEMAEESLIAAKKSMEEMIYIASHDLQTPLVTMDGYASELLENYRNILDEEGIYCLQRLKVNAQRMHNLVQSLLDISRLTTKKFPFRKINTNNLVKNVINELLLVIDKKDVKINIEKMPGIFGDKQRIEGVFRNIVTNAINYGGKNISIGYKKNRFYIQDDGIGIPEDQLERIFSPGERLKMTDVEGAGMGLTFCKKVIELHNGKIWAESKGENKGATVRFTVPVK